MLLGILLGLASLLAGWIVFSANGFYSPVLMLTGTLMMPLGLIILGMSLSEVLAESQHRIFHRHSRRERDAGA
jgi:predicted permease